MGGKYKKIRFKLSVYDKQNREWKEEGKYITLEQIAEKYDMCRLTCHNILHCKAKKYCKRFKIEKL